MLSVQNEMKDERSYNCDDIARASAGSGIFDEPVISRLGTPHYAPLLVTCQVRSGQVRSGFKSLMYDYIYSLLTIDNF
jgi:hypothetical protein